MKSKISFLTIKKVYNLLEDDKEHKFESPKHEYFKRIFKAHLINSLWAYCSIYTGLMERGNSVFDNKLFENLAEEAAGTLKVTKALYVVYSNYIKKNKEIKQDDIALSLLSSGVDIKDICATVSILISESLIDQINLITIDECDILAEYTCKCILSNLSDNVIKSYLLTDSTNKNIIISTFSISCLFCTFIPSKVNKKKIGKYTTEGMLLRSGIKYPIDSDMIYLSPKFSKLDKYRSREMYPEIYAFFSSLFPKFKLVVSHTSKSKSALSIPKNSFGIIDHISLGHINRVEITDIPVYDEISLKTPANSTETYSLTSCSNSTENKQSSNDNENHSSFNCFTIFIILYRFIASLITNRGNNMGMSHSKQKTTYNGSNKSTFFKEDAESRKNGSIINSQAEIKPEIVTDLKKKSRHVEPYPADDLEITFVDIAAVYGNKQSMRK